MKEHIYRREFLKQVAAWSAGAALIPVFDTQMTLGGKAEARPTISVAKGKDYEALVSTVLKPLGGIEAFVKKGDKVVVKPNIAWDRKPEQAACTHPLVVKALVQAALAAGAAQVLVFDRTCSSPKRCYVNSGIEKAVNSIGDGRAMCVHVDKRKFVPVQIKGAQSLHKFDFYRDALECDCYINVPIAKHHSSATLTMGLKNAMGVIGGSRGELHQDLGNRIADLALVIRPKLTVVDATRILLRKGPMGGSLKDVKVLDTLVAGVDPVAVDAYTTTLFDMRPEEIVSTVAAHKLGLGQIDLAKIKVVTA